MKRLFVNFKTFTPGTEFPCLVFLTYNAKILTISIVFYKNYDIP